MHFLLLLLQRIEDARAQDDELMRINEGGVED